MKTLAQKAADKQLEDAVKRAIEAYSLIPEGHTLTDFLVVIEGLNLNELDDDGVPAESLGMAFRGGAVRTSVAKGLILMAHEALEQKYAREEG